eukprot:2998981-Prymnesium_polylepis.1
MQPGAHRPFERPLRPEERGVWILKHLRLTARVQPSTPSNEEPAAWSLCRPMRSPAALVLGKGLMLGAWLFADNSSRAPGAPWGGAVGMPSLR